MLSRCLSQRGGANTGVGGGGVVFARYCKHRGGKKQELLLFPFPVAVRLRGWCCHCHSAEQYKWDSARLSIEKSESE